MDFKIALARYQNKRRADLCIPADAFFAQRAASKQLTRESIPLVGFRLVLAKKPSFSGSPANLNELVSDEIDYVLCDENAGVGRKLKETLGDLYEQVANGKKATYPRVTEAANSIRISAAVDAGFIWNTTARQYGLEVVELPELSGAKSVVSANVVSDSKRPTEALRFVRFLASSESGGPEFVRFHFDPITQDPLT